jgi:septal ring factor EnvC (AmiA/AmiB activator)
VTQVGETFLFKVTLEDDNLPTYLRKEKKERFEAISSELKSLEDQLRDLCTEISVIGRNIMNFDLVKEKITAQIDYNTLDEEDKQLVAELEKSLDKSNLFLTTDE